MRKLFSKHHRDTGIILVVLAVFILAGGLDAANRASEQAGLIEICLTGDHDPSNSAYDHSRVSFILPFIKETDSTSKEQSRDQIQRNDRSVRNLQARFSLCILLFWLSALTAFCIPPVARRMLFSTRGSQHAIISYIHDQDGQK